MHRWRAGRRPGADRASTAWPSIGGIPTQVALMLREPDFDALRPVELVQAIVIGGGPATPALVREARARFGAAVAVRYSCTEAGIGVGHRASTTRDEDAEVSVGRPQAGVELAVLDDDDRPVAAGEVGEVCLRSAAVMSGYYARPDRHRRRLHRRRGRPHRRPRLGRRRRAGSASSGAAKEMYVRGGYNVYPVEVEAVLAAHPAVADVAVVPRADDVMGEVGVAVVVPRTRPRRPTSTTCGPSPPPDLARHKLPEELRIVDALPLTAMEKVDRRALRAELRVE